MKAVKPYLRYRPSGIPWIGDVPEYWELKPLFTTMREIDDRNYGNKVQNVLSLSYGKIVDRDVESNFGLLPESFETYQIVEKGDVILRLTDLQNDQRSLRVGSVGRKGIITSAYVCLRGLEHAIAPEYAFWLLATYDFKKVFYGLGSGVRQVMGFVDLKRLPVVLPKIEEQRNIAAFLDHTTAQLDDLIDQKQQLIELLKEKRQALITSVVTKGLNPKAKMKDSGVAWLGQIPEHWGVKKLQYLKSEALMYGANESAEDDDRNLPRFLRITDLNSDGTLKDDTFKSLPVVVAKPYLLNDGDILLARTGATVGKAVRYRLSWGPCCFAGYLIRFRPDANQLNSVFFEYYTQSQAYWTEIYLSAIQATIQNVSAEKYSGFLVPVPPVKEQSEICEYLVNATNKLDLLAQRTEDSVERLREYRQSLISAAVTGKIDLSNWKTA